MSNLETTLDEQEKIVYNKFKTIEDNMKKHLYIMSLYDINRTLFYYVLGKHVIEFIPIIYNYYCEN